MRRYEESGLLGLREHSRSRKSRHTEQMDLTVEHMILTLREEHPYWGARKLQKLLESRIDTKLPSVSSIHSVLKRHGLVIESARGQGRSYKRFERKSANELWQMDFKGQFKIDGKNYCYPLTLCDDHSRYNLVLAACRNQKTDTVREHLTCAFKRYGLPNQILCDNGPPWGNTGHELTSLGCWLIRVGVEVIHGRPYHPQTQGKEERFHRTLKVELLSRTTTWRNFDYTQSCFEDWRHQYNHVRPHQALEYRTPSAIYSISVRDYPQSLPQASEYYINGDIIKRVKAKGEITFNGQFFYIGQAFNGEHIALRASKEKQWEVFYCWKCIGKIDLSKITKKSRFCYQPLIK